MPWRWSERTGSTREDSPARTHGFWLRLCVLRVTGGEKMRIWRERPKCAFCGTTHFCTSDFFAAIAHSRSLQTAMQMGAAINYGIATLPKFSCRQMGAGRAITGNSKSARTECGLTWKFLQTANAIPLLA